MTVSVQGDRADVDVVYHSSRRLRVLVLDEEFPFPLTSGKRIRTWALLSRAARDNDVVVLCHGPVNNEAKIAAQVNGIRIVEADPLPIDCGWRLWARLAVNTFSRFPYSVSKHYSAAFRRELNTLLCSESFDIVHCEWTPYARYLNSKLDLPAIVTTHNVETQILQRRAQLSDRLVEKAFFTLQALKMRRFEKCVLQRVRSVTAVSAEDAAQFHEWGVRNVRLVENGADLSEFVPSSDSGDNGTILFLASLDWYPNQDALLHLLDNIMPSVQQRIPTVRLQVVGRRAPEWLRLRVSQLRWAEFIGDVESVQSWLAHAAVVVVPLRIGGGSRIKILEALAMQKAVVSTSIGAEGLRLRPGEHLAIADTPAAFADEIVRLLSSAAERERLGECGRNIVTQRYSWDYAALALQDAWQGCVGTESAC